MDRDKPKKEQPENLIKKEISKQVKEEKEALVLKFMLALVNGLGTDINNYDFRGLVTTSENLAETYLQWKKS